MGEMAGFARDIELRLATADELRRREATQLAEAMQPLDHVRLAFERVAEVVHGAIIRPRCEELARRVGHVALTHLATPCSVYSICTFLATDRFPATAVVTMGVALDQEAPRCALFYSCDLRPALIGYERKSMVEISLESTPWEEAAAWVEASLLRVVETYLLVQRHSAYQQENVAIDPVCGMLVPLAAAEQGVEYGGRRYYFCAPSCRECFVERPALFLTGVAELPGSGTRTDTRTEQPANPPAKPLSM